MKNFFLTPERSVSRKLQEAVMALIVEARYEKDAILEAYLNEIYLGQRGSTAVHGVGEASRFFFGKGARDLALPESALIAAIIKSPNGLSPHADPERTRKRRDLVLELMREQGRIDDATLAEALAEPLRVAKLTPEPREARYFLDALQRQLPDFYGPGTLTTEGLQIYSTLDLRLQRAAAHAVTEELERLEKAYPKLAPKGESRLEACLVALRPQTGEVLALVGGRDYAKSQFDRCTQARRPAGSVFKPFVYAAALEPGAGGPLLTLAARVDDAPLELSTPSGPWRPKNFDHVHHGNVPIREALERSYNVATARLGQQVGIPRVVEMARRLGIESPLPAVPSLAIGAADLTPLELARAYATLANGGIRPQIRTFEDVVDPRGGTLERQPIEFERVLDGGTAYLVTSLLQGVVDRGTAASLRRLGLAGPVAGKTGTSNQERDAWFVGYTPELVAVVWVGFDEPRSLGIAASGIALPLWGRFLRETTGGLVRGSLPAPARRRRDRDRARDGRAGARGLSVTPGRVLPARHRAGEHLPGLGLSAGSAAIRDAPGILERMFDSLARIACDSNAIGAGACADAALARRARLSGPRRPQLPRGAAAALALAAEGDAARRASMRLVMLGLDADTRGRSAEASSQYERALQVDPNNPYAWLALARQEVFEGDPERGLADLDKAQALLGADERAAAHVAGIRGAGLDAVGQRSQGAPFLREARERAPGPWGDGMLDARELR